MAGDARPSPRRLLQGLGAVAIVVFAVLALRQLESIEQGTVVGGPVFSLGFLVIVGAVAGQVAVFARLPKLTGFLLAGICVGPQGFGLLSPSDVKALSLINALALALIALQAGAELTVIMLKRTWRSVLSSSLAQSLIVIPLTAIAFYAVSGFIPFLDGMDSTSVIAVALIWGTISLTRSPAVTLAILGETKAKGPVAEHSLGVVVCLDVLVLPLFAAAMAIARVQISGQAFDLSIFTHLGFELFASICAGTTFGLVIAALLRVITRERVFMVIVVGYAVTALSTFLRYDTLLVFVVAGFIVMNLTRFGHDLVHTSEQTSAGVMIVFFATAGAKLDLNALQQLWPIALAFFAVRTIATIISCRAGHALAKDPPVVKQLAWTAFISQAGVTIGLATIIADALPGIGKSLATLVIAVVGLNELVGPVVFTWGLKKAKEIPGQSEGGDDGGDGHSGNDDDGKGAADENDANDENAANDGEAAPKPAPGDGV
jgi:Kef-type K+ transport system membrane component KefB